MTRDQAEKRNAFADALEEVARLADAVPAGGWDVPPAYMAAECRRWAERYRVRIDAERQPAASRPDAP